MKKTLPITRAAALLAEFLEAKHPDFCTLTERQAHDAFALSVFKVWLSFMILTGRIEQ